MNDILPLAGLLVLAISAQSTFSQLGALLSDDMTASLAAEAVMFPDSWEHVVDHDAVRDADGEWTRVEMLTRINCTTPTALPRCIKTLGAQITDWSNGFQAELFPQKTRAWSGPIVTRIIVSYDTIDRVAAFTRGHGRDMTCNDEGVVGVECWVHTHHSWRYVAAFAANDDPRGYNGSMEDLPPMHYNLPFVP